MPTKQEHLKPVAGPSGMKKEETDKMKKTKKPVSKPVRVPGKKICLATQNTTETHG